MKDFSIYIRKSCLELVNCYLFVICILYIGISPAPASSPQNTLIQYVTFQPLFAISPTSGTTQPINFIHFEKIFLTSTVYYLIFIYTYC